jgi:hypothetical protein
MAPWTDEELTHFGEADEIRLTTERPDGSLRKYVRIWIVRVGGDLYVRSAYGPDNTWFRRAKAGGIGRIRAAKLERAVTFAGADPTAHADIDAAYRKKYGHYPPKIVETVVGPELEAVTIRLLPRTATPE